MVVLLVFPFHSRWAGWRNVADSEKHKLGLSTKEDGEFW